MTHLVEKRVRKIDICVRLELVLPVDSILPSLGKDRVGEVAVDGDAISNGKDAKAEVYSLLAIEPGRSIGKRRVEAVKVVRRGNLWTR